MKKTSSLSSLLVLLLCGLFNIAQAEQLRNIGEFQIILNSNSYTNTDIPGIGVRRPITEEYCLTYDSRTGLAHPMKDLNLGGPIIYTGLRIDKCHKDKNDKFRMDNGRIVASNGQCLTRDAAIRGRTFAIAGTEHSCKNDYRGIVRGSSGAYRYLSEGVTLKACDNSPEQQWIANVVTESNSDKFVEVTTPQNQCLSINATTYNTFQSGLYGFFVPCSKFVAINGWQLTEYGDQFTTKLASCGSTAHTKFRYIGFVKTIKQVAPVIIPLL